MICEFIDQMRSEGHAVESICRGLRKAGLQIAARTYRMWTSPRRAIAARVVSDAEVEDVVRQLVWKPDAQGRRKMQPAGLYGRRKMLAEVRRAGLATASPGAVDRAMRTLGLSGVVRAKKVYTTSPDSDALRAPDLSRDIGISLWAVSSSPYSRTADLPVRGQLISLLVG
ncbi:hypothetical protein [Corynebacterium sp. p3-SID1140]|nr:hypothetical protein [Corynebacterium sp. p3-SID1140]MCT1462567.1 hypothetical protein [Corynebacterium sp. p3-SID1140]